MVLHVLIGKLFGFLFFFSSRRRHTRCALVTGVQTCALPISGYMPGFLWGVQLDLPQTLSEHVFGLESIVGIPTQVVSDTLIGFLEIGRASCRERVCQYV